MQPSESAESSPTVSTLSDVSGMDNSLSLAEIDRIIGNLIGKDGQSPQPDDNVGSPYQAGGDWPQKELQPPLPTIAPPPRTDSIGRVRRESASPSASPPSAAVPGSPPSPVPNPLPPEDSPTDVPTYLSPKVLVDRDRVSSASDSPTGMSPYAGADVPLQEPPTLGQPNLGITPATGMPRQKITLFRRSMDGAEGQVAGIGIVCGSDDSTGDAIIQRIVPGGPASNSGQIFPGDTLLQINGTSISGMSLPHVKELLSGTSGTPVSILVSHNPAYVVMAADSRPSQLQAPLTVGKPSFENESAPSANVTSVSGDKDREDAEERRLVRERVLAARRKSGAISRSSTAGSSEPARTLSSESVDRLSSQGTDRQSEGPWKPPPTLPIESVYPPLPAAYNETGLESSPAHDFSTPDTSKNGSLLEEREREIKAAALPKDAEGKSLEELKMSFTMRMNEAIRMQRERMRLLLSDVDNKIVSLKMEHGLPKAQDTNEATPEIGALHAHDLDNKENHVSGEAFSSSGDAILTPSGSLGVGSALSAMEKPANPLIDAQPPPPIKGGMEDSPPTVSSSVMERDMQTEKLMREMSQLRQALAAVTGSVGVARSGSAWGEAALPEAEADSEGNFPDGVSGSWLQRHRGYEVQGGPAPPQDLTDERVRLGGVEADLLTMAEKSQQKYLDIVKRLEKETLKSEGGGRIFDQSIEDHEDTIDEVDTEDEYQGVGGEQEEEEEPLRISYNPALMPAKGCMTPYRKQWPERPMSPSQDEAEAARLANKGQKRSVLGAGIAACKEVLNPGLKTPYSPRHVMTPRGPMVMAPEGPVLPSQHPFVQEQMLVLKCVKQYPELANMAPEVLKAASVRFELGLEPDLVDDHNGVNEERPPAGRQKKTVVYGAGVAETDGNSAAMLHEASLAKRKAALAAAKEAAAQHALMLEQMQLEQEKIHQLQAQAGFKPPSPPGGGMGSPGLLQPQPYYGQYGQHPQHAHGGAAYQQAHHPQASHAHHHQMPPQNLYGPQAGGDNTSRHASFPPGYNALPNVPVPQAENAAAGMTPHKMGAMPQIANAPPAQNATPQHMAKAPPFAGPSPPIGGMYSQQQPHRGGGGRPSLGGSMDGAGAGWGAVGGHLNPGTPQQQQQQREYMMYKQQQMHQLQQQKYMAAMQQRDQRERV